MTILKQSRIALICYILSIPVLADQQDEDGQTRYFNAAFERQPDLDNGRKLYRYCVTCHGPEGWGSSNGAYPQIAGQLKNVLIKQLDDIRSGHRDNPIMRAFTSPRILPDAQAIADVAGYISALPMTPHNGQAVAADLRAGQAIYQRDCSNCHGDSGQGSVDDVTPAIHGQHFEYLRRQFIWIKDGRRKNADKKMASQIRSFTQREQNDVLAYTASLRAPEGKIAAPDWSNPDFAQHDRRWQPSADYKRRSRPNQ